MDIDTCQELHPTGSPAWSADLMAQPGPYLVFRLGQEQYGVDLMRVQEIRRYQAPNRLAGAAPEVLGVIDLRGAVVPVLDMRTKFGLPARQCDQFTMTIVLNLGARQVGVVVDAVVDVIELKPAEIRPLPGLGDDADMDGLVGIGAVKEAGQERMVILLEIERLLGGVEPGLPH